MRWYSGDEFNFSSNPLAGVTAATGFSFSSWNSQGIAGRRWTSSGLAVDGEIETLL